MPKQFLLHADGSAPPDANLPLLHELGIPLVLPTPMPRQPGMRAVERDPEPGPDGVWRQAWSLEPVTPEPMDPEALRQTLEDAVQAHLDATARARGYDSMLSCATYAASRVPRFRAEAETAIAWRDAVWTHCYAVLAAVMAGERPPPTAGELVAGLPAIAWPEAAT